MIHSDVWKETLEDGCKAAQHPEPTETPSEEKTDGTQNIDSS